MYNFGMFNSRQMAQKR